MVDAFEVERLYLIYKICQSIEQRGNIKGGKEKAFSPCITNLHGDDGCCERSLAIATHDRYGDIKLAKF
jgi:hypothetical protein